MELKFGFIHIHKLYYTTPIQVVDKLSSVRPVASFSITIDGEPFTCELSPIQGFHSSSLEECIQIYKQELEQKTVKAHSSKFNLTSKFFNLISLSLKVQSKTPLVYAIEQALFSYALKALNIESLFDKFREVNSAHLKTDFNSMSRSSYTKYKIRPQHNNKKLKAHLTTTNEIVRLDGNRCFTPTELQVFLSDCSHNQVEFIEDPYKHKEDYINNSCDFALALDENLEWALNNQITFSYAVIKPSLYSISKTFELMQQCHDKEIDVIISSSYEGKSVHQLLKIISTYKNSSTIAQGLSPEYFLHPLCTPFTKWSDLLFADNSINHSIDWRLLFQSSENNLNHLSSLLKGKQNIAIYSTNNMQTIELIISLWMLKKTVVVIPENATSREIQQYKNEVPIHEIITGSGKVFNLPSKYIHTPIDFNQPALILFTSGSSGISKGVCYSLEGLFSSAFSSIDNYNMSSRDVFYQSLPLNHIGGFMIFFRAMALNAPYILGKSPQKLADLNIIIDYFSLVPTQLHNYLNEKPLCSLLCKSKGVIIGGSKISKHLLSEAKELSIPLYLTYGMSETIAQVSSSKVNCYEREAGFPLQGYKLKIINNLVYISSEILALGVYKNQKFSKLKLKDEYYCTQDIGSIIDGKLFIEGRNDRIFISGGENISPEEVEEVAISHSKIERAVLVSVPDKHFGEVGFLFHTCKGDTKLSSKMLKEFFTTHMSVYKCPKYFFECDLSGANLKPSYAQFKERALALMMKEKDKRLNLITTGDPLNPALIFLHGFMGDHKEWDLVISELSTKYYCITLDLPGHGDNLTVNKKKEFWRQLDKIVNDNLNSPSLIGYSMGGRIYLEYLLNYPSAHKVIHKVIVESSHPGIPSNDKESRLKHDLQLLTDIHTQNDLESFLARWYSNPLFGKISNHPNFSNRNKSKTISSVKGWQEALNCWTVANQKDCSILFSQMTNLFYIYGENDQKYKKIGQSLKRNCYEIKEAAHNTHFEQPRIYINLISNLLKQ